MAFPPYGLPLTYALEYPSEWHVPMMYDGGTPTIGMQMMLATIQEMALVRMVPHGTYPEYGGK